jgi:hypothetical protein
VILENRSNSKPGSSSDDHATAEMCARTNVNAIFQSALMINARGCIYNAQFTDAASWIDNSSCHDNGSIA